MQGEIHKGSKETNGRYKERNGHWFPHVLSLTQLPFLLLAFPSSLGSTDPLSFSFSIAAESEEEGQEKEGRLLAGETLFKCARVITSWVSPARLTSRNWESCIAGNEREPEVIESPFNLRLQLCHFLDMTCNVMGILEDLKVIPGSLYLTLASWANSSKPLDSRDSLWHSVLRIAQASPSTIPFDSLI